MSTGRDEALAESAGRIADGRDEGWDETLDEGGVGEAERAALRRVARIARAWRDLGVRPGADPAGGPPALFHWGHLEVREKLGEGSFGEVYRAWDPALEREVALKLRRSGGDEALAREELAEARRLARVRHAHVLVIHGVDVRDGRAGFWTELIHGETLEAQLAVRGMLGAPEAGAIGLDLCRALAAVHAAGLAHGDVKAGNVMREAGGRIVLMDFGSGGELSGGGADGAATLLTGTPLSAAPETLAGGGASPAADQYALGALLFRLVTGRHPVPATTLAELREKHARGERESLRAARPDLPSAFVAAVERALDPEPSRRWPDAGAFERALVGTLVPPGPALDAPRTSRARTGLLAAAAVLVAVAAIALWPRLAARGPRASGPAATQAPPAATQEAPTAAAPPAAEGPAGEATPGAAAEVEVAASLWRARGGDRVRLEDGGAIAAGDHLFLDYLGVEPLYVYVLDEDERGETYTLFPVAGTDLANPLPAGVPLRLPGQRAGEPFDWVVTSAGGREHVLVVASRRRLAVLEDLVAATTPAESGREVRYAQVPDEAMATLRGIGGLAPAPAGGAPESRLGALAAGLAARKGADLWVRHLVLQSR